LKRILASLLIISAIGVGAIGATRAFFSDTETSKNNILQAGSIDLKIDNTSYYNGVASPLTTWTLADLNDGHGPSPNGAYLFFNFPDLKPGDRGEDTISLHVNDNKSWACMNVKLTKNDDNTCTEPELLDDPTCTDPNAPGNANLFDGELAQRVNFIWWGDDGDNVFETDEQDFLFQEGSASAIFNGETWTIADSNGSLWDESPTPLDPEKTYYIGKAWCFGNLTKAPLAPSDTNTPLNSNGGFLCDGSLVNNAAQTDVMLADVSFYAIQSRNNSNFLCGDPNPTPTPTPGLCEKKPDVMLVLDRSGSISAPELVTLKNAGNAFINALNLSATTAHSGQSSFATLGSLDLQLTDDPTAAHNAVNALVTGGFTNLFQGLSLADTELQSVRDRADGTSPDFVVVITDGEPNRPAPPANAQALAAAEADDLRAHGVVVYVVGVGVTPANETYLKTQIADDAAHYFPAANFADLEDILEGIANCPR